MGLFTLEDGTPEYANLAGQVQLPGVIALVKGKGASAVSGEITETRLTQAFVAASSASAACCAGGASSSACK